MSTDEIFSRLVEIFGDVMDLQDVELGPETTAADIEEWDSLSHVRLMVSIEREFKVKFTNAEIDGLKKFGDIRDLLVAKGMQS